MAITKIKAIKSTLDKAINYICNPAKTQGKLLVDSFGCVPEFAAQQMEATAKKNKRGGCRKAYHLMQSFAPDDNITPEKALEIGRKFADQVTQGKYEYVIAVHTDKDHLHCHIIFNAVDAEEYKKYRYKGYSERDRIRDISDKLCKDNGLSVLPRWTKGKGCKSKKQQYKKSWSQKMCEAIDRTVLTAETFEDFITAMEMEEGFTFKNGKQIGFIAEAEGQKKYTRCATAGDYYTEEMIRDRIANKEKYKDIDFSQYHIKAKKKKAEAAPRSEGQEKTDAEKRVSLPAATENAETLKEPGEPNNGKSIQSEKQQKTFHNSERTEPEKAEQQETSGSHGREKNDSGRERQQEASDSRQKTDPGKEKQQETSDSHESSRKNRSDGFKTERKIRLISDLSKNVKAQDSPGYRYVAEKNNLNTFVKTMNFMEKYDIETPEKFRKFYESCYDEVTKLNKEIQNVDLEITELGERRSYIRKYFKYLKYYNTFMKYRNMNYYREHENEIREFKLSKLWMERNGINPREYKHQEYQEEYVRLRNKKEALKEKLQPAKALLYDTGNVMKNVESVLGIKFYESEENEKEPKQSVRENMQQNNKKDVPVI